MLNGLLIFAAGIGLIFVLIESGSLSLFFNEAELAVVREGAWWSIFLLFAAMMHEYGGNIWLGKQDFRRYNLNVLIRPVIYLILLLIVFGAAFSILMYFFYVVPYQQATGEPAIGEILMSAGVGLSLVVTGVLAWWGTSRSYGLPANNNAYGLSED